MEESKRAKAKSENKMLNIQSDFAFYHLPFNGVYKI